MEGKKSFLLYSEIIDLVEELTDEEAGKLFKVVLQYVNDKNPEIPQNKSVRLVFLQIKQDLKRDLDKWKDIKSKRVEAGRLGGMAKANNSKSNLANLASASFDTNESSKEKQNVANLAVNDNVNVNVNDNVNVKYNNKTNITNKTNKTIFDKMEKSENPFVNYLQSKKVLDENDLFIMPNLENYFESLFKDYDKSDKESWNERYSNVQMAVKYIIPFLKEAIRKDENFNKYGYIVHSIESSLNRKYDFDFKDFLSEEV